MATTDYTIRGCARRRCLGCRSDGTGNRKGSHIEIVRRIIGMIDNWADYVGTVESIATSAVIIFEIVVELERLAALQRNCAVHAPSIFELLHAAAHVGDVIPKNPGETLRQIEV